MNKDINTPEKLIDSLNFFKKFQNWQYKNTALLIFSFGALYFLYGTDFLNNLIAQIGSLGYVSAFFAGIFFVSIFTVAPSSIIIFDLANQLNAFGVAILAGAGAVVGDYIIYRFLKDRVFDELKIIIDKVPRPKFLLKFFLTPYFSWLVPLWGALIIASPLPDELGVSILGLSKISRLQFIFVTFFLNTVGIMAIVALAGAF
jgi:hypothetical protein